MDKAEASNHDGQGTARHGATGGTVKKSWAAMLGSNLPATLNKNILEIVLEKDQRGP